MKTFVVYSIGSYGDMVQVVNALKKEDVEEFAKNHNYCGNGFQIVEINTKVAGLVFDTVDY